MRSSFISDTQARTIATQLTCVFAALANGMFCSSTASAASWNEFHADDQASYAYDAQSRRQSPRPRISILKNFLQPTPQGDLSARLLYEADCDVARIRLINGIYSRNKTAEGGVSGMINSKGWMTANTSPLHEKLYAILCEAPGQAESPKDKASTASPHVHQDQHN